MIWLAIYLLIGIVTILVTSRRNEKKGIVPTGIFIFDVWLFPLGILLWPLVLLFANADAKIQVQEKEERERREIQKETERPENLSPLIGSMGIVLTKLAPRGKIEIDERQFEAVSESGSLPSKTEIVVTGIASFQEFAVKKAELIERGNSE